MEPHVHEPEHGIEATEAVAACDCEPIIAHMALDLAAGDGAAARTIANISKAVEPRPEFEADPNAAIRIAWSLTRDLRSCCDDYASDPEAATRSIRRTLDAFAERHHGRRTGTAWLMTDVQERAVRPKRRRLPQGIGWLAVGCLLTAAFATVIQLLT